MKKQLQLVLLLSFIPFTTFSQVGIGTNVPESSAQLDVNSSNKGFLPPRMTVTERNAIVNPANGLQIFNTTTGCINYYIGTGWHEVCGTLIQTAEISTLTCNSASVNGSLTSGSAANNVSATIPYTLGNGGTYGAQNLSSTGITGLTAVLTSGVLANGSGSLLYTISGTPSNSGTAFFNISIGGQSCNLSISIAAPIGVFAASTVNCSNPTAVVDVTNSATGKTWMDRNLGASQVATSSSHIPAFGDLYQWGRRSDGHQCRSFVPTSSNLSSSDQPAGSFIFSYSTPFDWRSPQNNNLWQGVNGINNPCPSGYRIPTDSEWENERLTWSINTLAGAFASPLKLTAGGYRHFSSDQINNVGLDGKYWSSTIVGSVAKHLMFNDQNNVGYIYNNYRAYGHSVRCIKN
jgi:hypothetical protein